MFQSHSGEMKSEMKDMCKPEKIRDSLETLRGEERLDKSAIKGIEELEGEIALVKKNAGKVQLIGTNTIDILVDGTKVGQSRYVNLIAGTGVTITHNRVGERNDITISASSTAMSVMTATGTVNGSNTSFIFASKPTLVISDGVSLRENGGWTWNAGTLTATLTVPSQFDIYGLS